MHRGLCKQVALGIIVGAVSVSFIPSKTLVLARDMNKEYGCAISSYNKDLQVSSIDIKNNSIKYNNKWIQLDVNYPSILIVDNNEIQDKINKQFFADALWIKESMENEAKDAYDMAIKGDYEYRPYSLDINYKVDKNKDGILSVHSIGYYYKGGAHGTTEIIPYNLNLKTGKEIKLLDLFKDKYDYKKIINEKILEQRTRIDEEYKKEFIKNGGKKEEYRSIFFESFKGIDDNTKFYITDNCIVIYYASYEIAPYAFGIPTFEISFNDLKDGLK